MNGTTDNSPSQPFNPYEEGRRLLKRLQNAEGGSFGAADTCALLGISIDTLRDLHRSNGVVAWVDEDRAYRFPRWQFKGNRVLPGISECLSELGDDPGTHLVFFLTASELVGNRSPLDLLRLGLREEALALAREFRPKE